ncbi:hypothetical protein [Phytoactinopolyspora halotolerans]|uniref:Uncharacterized protein n=1 Tax=Phytoactinopolyspora halotolerans TaxID=1981512 RepID=A0A6L9S6P0_9ACTN|nr:hypothetical protein [Phytoactinopolyspora halotolerans]NED99659.1 hypothetical protein [Phytoactinopolyspora halotolerans]
MKRHEADVTSLVFGLLFFGVFVVWVLVHAGAMGIEGIGQAVPILFVAVGLAGLAASISKLRRNREN